MVITFEKFKKLYNCLEEQRQPEIGIYFKDNKDDYMIIKYSDYLTFGRFGCNKDEIYRFNNIDELYNSTIENICLKEDWNKISDILIDLTFSVTENKDELNKQYHIDL